MLVLLQNAAARTPQRAPGADLSSQFNRVLNAKRGTMQEPRCAAFGKYLVGGTCIGDSTAGEDLNRGVHFRVYYRDLLEMRLDEFRTGPTTTRSARIR